MTRPLTLVRFGPRQITDTKYFSGRVMVIVVRVKEARTDDDVAA